jgi:hypothetical protein
MNELKIAKADAATGYTPVQMRCPMCHEADANMSVDLATGDLGCNECGDTLSFDDAQTAVEEMEAAAMKWRKLLGALSGLSSLVNDAEAKR